MNEDTSATFAVRCSWCGLRYTPERWKAGHSFCKPAHRLTAHRAGRDDAVAPFRPRSLRVAHLALDQGVPFEQLVLSQGVRDLVLAPGRTALVLCVWQPADVGFVPIDDRHFDSQNATAVKEAAQQTAAHGASLAEKAGFRSQSIAVEAAPTWKGILKTAEERNASLIVLGSHRRSGLVGHLLGSVAAAVVSHSASSVLVVRRGS
jgi:nucleotide-binding universal stress UspA family protein